MRTLGVVALLLVCAAGGYFVWTRVPAKAAPPVDPPRAQSRPAPKEAVIATGIVRLQVGAQVRVGAQISGIVRKLHVAVGSHVSQGDTIAEIDTRTIEAKIAQAKAQAEMDRVTLGKDRNDLSRTTALAADGLIPRQQAQDQEWTVKQSEARLAKSESDLDAARVDLNYATIRAPISGVIASVATQEGETVAASFATPTFVTIIEDNALELVAMVDETDIGGVRPGQRVVFTTEAFPSKELGGVVTRINPTATIVSGVVNYEVIVTIAKGATFLKPDMTANITIHAAVHTGRRS